MSAVMPRDRAKPSRIIRRVLIAALLCNLGWGTYDLTRGHLFGLTCYVCVVALIVTMAWQAKVIRRIEAEDRPRPDYSAIAAMEREIYGETFEHEGAPKTVPPVAALFKPGLMHEDAGAFETFAALRRGRKDYLRISGFRTECTEGHGEQLWVQGHGRMCPKCDEHRSNLRWERPT